MWELTSIGLVMKVAYWVWQFWVSAPDPELMTQPTQTQFEIAFPSIQKEPIDYEN